MNFESIAKAYLRRFQITYQDSVRAGASSVELRSRPHAHRFLEELWASAAEGRHELEIVHDAQVEGTRNAPDWRVQDRMSHGVFFYGEHKSANLDGAFQLSNDERNQVAKYLDMERPVFVFDGIEFLFFAPGNSLDSPERIELIKKPVDVSQKWERQILNPQVDIKFRRLLENPGFKRWTEEQLVEQLAVRTRLLADEIHRFVRKNALGGATSSENRFIQALHELFEVVRCHHDPSLSDKKACAEFIAQVLAFGLFYAHSQTRHSGKSPSERNRAIQEFWREETYFAEAEKLRPFLAVKDALLNKLKAAEDVALAFEEITSILAHAEFQGGSGGTIDYHSLFEKFFSKFNNTQRFDRGVFYTPPVLTNWLVAFIERMCELHFGRSIRKCADRIIDPCCGTGGFIESIAASLSGKSDSDFPSLIGLEILPAPYALANSRLSSSIGPQSLLDHVHLYLVDTLSDLFDDPPEPEEDGFSADLYEASSLTSPPVRIIVGNPPSSIHNPSHAPRERIEELLNDFRPPPESRKSRQNVQQALNNEAVRFLRWSCEKVLESERGIVALVLPGAFVHNISYEFARSWLAKKFDEIWVLELDADVRSGTATQSLFRVKQGRAVLVAVLNPDLRPSSRELDESAGTCESAQVRYFDVSSWQLTQKKQFLSGRVDLNQFRQVELAEHRNFFAPSKQVPRQTWEQCWPLTSSGGSRGIFEVKCSGVKLAPSSLLFHTDENILESRCVALGGLRDADMSSTSYKRLVSDWFSGQQKPPLQPKFTKEVCKALGEAVGTEGSVKRYLYRPFLEGRAVYDHRVFEALRAVSDGTRPRPEVADVFERDAIAIGVAPAPAQIANAMTRFVSFCWSLPDNDLVARGNAMVYANLRPVGAQRRGSAGTQSRDRGISNNVRPELICLFAYSQNPGHEVLYYTYAILSSYTFLNVFEGALHLYGDPSRPPRVPVFSDRDLRQKIAGLGRQIALCERDDCNPPKRLELAVFNSGGENEFRLTESKIDSRRQTIDLYSESEKMFQIGKIPSEVLNLKISGHDVVKKWLREKSFGYLRRTFRAMDLEELLSLLRRIDHQQVLIGQLDALISPLLSADRANEENLVSPIGL